MNDLNAWTLPAKRHLLTAYGIALFSLGGLSSFALAAEPEDLSRQIKVERVTSTQPTKFRIKGPSLRPGDAYAFSIPGEQFGTTQVPTIKAKSCGCLNPSIVTNETGDWSLHVQLNVTDSTVTHSYHEQLVLETTPDADVNDLLPLSFAFPIVQPIRLECDTQSLDYQLDNVVIRGRWQKDFSVEGLTFAAAPSFKVSVGSTKIDKLEDQPPYAFSGSWALTIESTSTEPPPYCRLNILDQEGTIRGSIGFRPLVKGRLELVTPTVRFQRIQNGWEAKLFLKVNDGKPLTPQEVESIRANGVGITTQISTKGEKALLVSLTATELPSDVDGIDVDIQGLGTSCTARVLIPSR